MRVMGTDTITAISTPSGEGAIAIVRLSGAKAIAIVNTIFKGKNLNEVQANTCHYGNSIHPMTGEIADGVIVSVIRVRRRFRREDVVEVNCHGGMVTVNRVLQIILNEGARLAEPGEFTKGAFLHGR